MDHASSTRLLSFALFVLLFGYSSLAAVAQTGPSEIFNLFVATHYDARIEVDIANKSIKGTVVVRVEAARKIHGDMDLDCGDLTIDEVTEDGSGLRYFQADHRLHLSPLIPEKAHELRDITIRYHGSPRRGIRFFPDRMQVYTVFSTSQWMVCSDDPNERATLRLKLVLPPGLNSVANGRLVGKYDEPGNKTVSDWQLDTPVPTYTFGFSGGPFHEIDDRHGRVQLRYLGTVSSAEDLHRVFHDTADMIAFYEDRAGVRYPQLSYTQVLAAGGVEQEMAGFTALRETYGNDVMKSDRDIWLGAHELAHQWWGIMVGCRAWTHFWLNEGMASFMADAYKEHRFGREEYLKEIEAARKAYEKVRAAGKDRSLVFPDWLHPSAEDRSLVYDKGAYVLHLLREEMGEREFWAGMRLYTRRYFGKSVTTAQFQAAMQEAAGKPLAPFFDKWVYLTGR
jgi:aminopeptidase N